MLTLLSQPRSVFQLAIVKTSSLQNSSLSRFIGYGDLAIEMRNYYLNTVAEQIHRTKDKCGGDNLTMDRGTVTVHLLDL